MKFQSAARRIEASEPIEERKVTILATAKTYQLFIKGIYPDIIKAITRELITNAWDSQTERGNIDRAFEVHTPGEFEPFFSVRDYGISMSHEFMMNEFTRIGESTKDNSDKVAGMFGMGRISALGYTDTFSVQCWLDGRTRIYDVYLAADGIPSVKFVYEDDSDEEQGVLVTVGVRPEDNYAFKSNTSKMLASFPSPIVLDGFEREPEAIRFQGTDWQLLETRDAISRAHIRMGCVLYPINSAYLPWNYTYMEALKHAIILDFPIGTFGVAGSREDIQYENGAIEKITEALHRVNVEFSKQFHESIVKEDSPLLAHMALQDAKKNWPGLTATLSADSIYLRGLSLTRLMNQKVKLDDELFKAAKIMVFHADGRAPKIRRYDEYSKPNLGRHSSIKYVLLTTVMLQNLNKRVLRWKNELREKGIVVNKDDVLIIYTDQKFDSYVFKRMAAIFNPTFVDLTKVQPWRVKRERGPGIEKQADELWLNSFLIDANSMDRKPMGLVDQTKEVIYVVTEGNQPTRHSREQFNLYFDERKITDKVLYQIPRFQYNGFMKRFKNVKFLNIDDEIDELLATLTPTDDEILAEAAFYSISPSELEPKIYQELLSFSDVKERRKHGGFKSVVIQRRKDVNDKFVAFQNGFRDKRKAFFEKYPILSFIPKGSMISAESIKEYITLKK